MGRGLIPGTIWKISCHNLFITYFTLSFFQVLTYIAEKIFGLTNWENKSFKRVAFVQLANLFVSSLVSKRSKKKC